MSNKGLIVIGLTAFALLVGASLWLLLRPPAGRAGIAHSLSGTIPVMDLRYSYDPNVFKPAPYSATAEFPLRLDAVDWSLYGKRLQGMGLLLEREPQPFVYSFITDAGNSVYSEFYGLRAEGESDFEEVPLAGQRGVRQRLQLVLTEKSRGWPSYFPLSVIGEAEPQPLDPNEIAEHAFEDVPGLEIPDLPKPPPASGSGQTAWAYSWALFVGEDLYIFQAVASRELTTVELLQAEAMIGEMEFAAMRGDDQKESAPSALPQPPGAAPPAGE